MKSRWKDWYEQGIRDLDKAKLDMENGFYEWACFSAQQSAEKIIKALGLKIGYELWGHSLTEMLELLKDHIEIPEKIKESAQFLDIFYISTRYPNGFVSGKPADYFNRSKAQEAISEASNIIRFCESHLFR